MSRNFLTTSRLTAPSIALTTAHSSYAWVKGASIAIGRIFDWNDAIILWRDGANTGFLFYRGWTGGAQWSLLDATTGVTVANWNHVGVTYDGASTANDPIFYVNGVAYPTPSEDQTPTGSLVTGTVPLLIGNSGGFNRAYAGSIAWLGVHDVVLTPAEMTMAMLQGQVARGQLLQPPLGWSSPDVDLSGAQRNLTVTGTTIPVDDPPVIPPWAALAA